ncbi:unnamed protein product [Urochloa decumbens]|uniref:F-box domain-containing protein n=1 Tax=Urochloa decumbens TaxID=240449 RepID=A0ABC9FJM0_9POAL
MIRRRRRPSSPAEALPDDLLREILLRLPPHPSSLHRVGLVCKQWQRLSTDANFISRFHAHHRTPPLLGYFAFPGTFVPTQVPPCPMPPTLCSLYHWYRERGVYWRGLLDCRRGHLLIGATRLFKFRFVITEFTVFNPMSGVSVCNVTTEPQPGKLIAAAVVVVAGGTNGYSFRLIALFSNYQERRRLSASVYSSDSGVWVNSVMALVTPSPIDTIDHPSTLVGNAIYWLPDGGEILQFDMERLSLAIIEQPPHVDVNRPRRSEGFRRWIVPSLRHGHFGLAILSGNSIHFWVRKTEISNATTWELCKSVQLDRVLPLELKEEHMPSPLMIGFAEESNAIFISTHDGVFMTNIESMKFKKLPITSDQEYCIYIHPYSSF